MSDIIHYFPIKASLQKIFEMISTPSGLDIWWTKSSSGECEENGQYELGFGPGYDWKAQVSVLILQKHLNWRSPIVIRIGWDRVLDFDLM